MKMSERTRMGRAGLFYLLLVCNPGLAAPPVETTVEVRAGGTRSDNLERTAIDADSGTIYSAGFALDVERDGLRFDYDLNGDLDWRKYSDGAFESDLFGYFDGTARFDIAREVFSWMFQETYGQQSNSPTAIPTPETLENINYLTTGPRLSFPLGGNTKLSLDGSYSSTNYERSALDSERYNAAVALVRVLSKSNELSVNGATQEVQFDDSVANPDYETRQFFLRYAGSSARGSLVLDLGYTEVENELQSSDGLLARLDLERRISPASTINAFVSRQFSDSGDIFRSRIGQGGASADAPVSLAIGDPFEQRTVGATWNLAKGRTSVGLGVERSEEIYERTVSANRSIDKVNVHFSRRMTPRLTLRLAAHQDREEFDTISFDARTTEADVNIDWHFGRQFGTTLRYGWYERSASDPGAEVSERQVGVSLFYRPPAR